MVKVFVVNGSPDKAKGNTAMVLVPFLAGMEKDGARIDLVYSKDLKVTPCTGEMYCWYRKPGHCIHKDIMQEIYPRVKSADVLIIATPVYIPIPGELQDFINRLCPLILPRVVKVGERTRARFHEDVNIKKILLVFTGGWWERGNFETVTMIAEELALNGGVEFSGALIRPHAHLMKDEGGLTNEGQAIIKLLEETGFEYASTGKISKDRINAISRPLLSHTEMLDSDNKSIDKALLRQVNVN
ncbi:MAG: flavodoxin family protein [Chloroflexi bacterium]|nr:flavodoxin family protein [Chloroflexota bacterium]